MSVELIFKFLPENIIKGDIFLSYYQLSKDSKLFLHTFRSNRARSTRFVRKWPLQTRSSFKVIPRFFRVLLWPVKINKSVYRTDDKTCLEAGERTLKSSTDEKTPASYGRSSHMFCTISRYPKDRTKRLISTGIVLE